MPNDITTAHEEETKESADQSQKIQSLREMINNAERTIQGAKAMLLQLEGKKKTGRPRKLDDENGTVVEGTFDGQIMFGSDSKQYPVPANYASKSKLVEGDMLKLTITSDGSFVYKQIGPIERRHIIGIITQDDKGNYYIVTEGTPYRVLLASITYFKAEPGDEVAALIPREGKAQKTFDPRLQGAADAAVTEEGPAQIGRALEAAAVRQGLGDLEVVRRPAREDATDRRRCEGDALVCGGDGHELAAATGDGRGFVCV